MKCLLLSILFTLSSALCPYGATYYAPDNLCYLTAQLPAQWTAAESICRNLGGHLANIRTQQQNDFVHLAVETLTAATHVGVYYDQGEWKYSDGSVATFTNFESKEFTFLESDDYRGSQAIVQPFSSHYGEATWRKVADY